jgi:hypothetical protein
LSKISATKLTYEVVRQPACWIIGLMNLWRLA